jgi:hypothetical protein
MKLWNERFVAGAGTLLAVAGLVVFGVSSSKGAFGLPTDVQEAKVEISVDKTEAAPGETVVLSVVVTDANGDPVANTDCVFGLTSQPGISADVSPDEAATDANGLVTATLDVGENPGTVTVEVTCGAASAVLSVNVGGAALPPGSAPEGLPASGVGYAETGSSNAMSTLLLVLLGALGVTLLGTGVVATRTWRARD